MKGIILAAGLGKRLGKITKNTPKPLLPVNEKPIIELIIEKLRKSGIDEIGINLFYKAELIRRSLNHIPGLYFVIERYLSGTGGGLLHFKNFVSENFLLHNCDVLSDIDLKKVIKEHERIKPLATIVLVKNYKTNRVRVKGERVVRFYRKRMDDCYTYTGIAVISKRIFEYFPENKKIFNLIEVYNNAIKNSELLYAYITSRSWKDIGTPEVFYSLSQQKKLLF
ncbi:MAG: nucleotidyltransferase family protein [candidate division WOR-3 bacterium]|nr:nucleotidyltransferase family protein [candidate division WOR-3 bacterium]